MPATLSTQLYTLIPFHPPIHVCLQRSPLNFTHWFPFIRPFMYACNALHTTLHIDSLSSAHSCMPATLSTQLYTLIPFHPPIHVCLQRYPHNFTHWFPFIRPFMHACNAIHTTLHIDSLSSAHSCMPATLSTQLYTLIPFHPPIHACLQRYPHNFTRGFSFICPLHTASPSSDHLRTPATSSTEIYKLHLLCLSTTHCIFFICPSTYAWNVINTPLHAASILSAHPCTCTHPHTFTHIHAPSHTQARASPHTHTHTRIHAPAHTSTHLHTHPCTHPHIHPPACTIHAPSHKHMRAHMLLHTHTYTSMHLHTHPCTCPYIHTPVCIHAPSHTHTFMHLYTHPHTHAHRPPTSLGSK